MSDLAPAEEEKLNEFQMITSFPESEHEKVVSLLRNNYWNLEVALSKYFDGLLDFEASREPFVEHEQPQHMIQREPMTPRNELEFLQGFLNGTDHSLLMPQLPIVRPISNRWRAQPGIHASAQFGWNTFGQSPLLFLLLLIPRSLTFLLTGISWVVNLLFPTSPDNIPPEATLASWNPLEHYRALTHDDPPFEIYKGDFNTAFEEAKLESKFILLIILGSSEKSTEFVKKVLNNDAVSQSIKDHDPLVYMANAAEAQGHEIARSFKTRSLPSLYLMANVASGPNAISSMSLLSRIPVNSVQSFVGRMQLEIEKYNPELITKRIEQEELKYSRQLRDMQDKAYEESVIADKIKQSKKEEELRIKHEKEIEAQWKATQRSRWFRKMASQFQDPLEGLRKGDYTSIRFKLPSGELITRKFAKGQTLRDIYAFVSVHVFLASDESHDCNHDEEKGEDQEEVDETYEHEFDFELISPMPRFAVAIDQSKIEDAHQLWPNGSIMVEFNE